MFTRVVETEQGTANVVAEHKDESILQLSLDLQDQLYVLVNDFVQDYTNPQYNQLLALMVLSNINVYNVTENIEKVESDMLFKNVEKSINGLMNYLKRTDVKVANSELIALSHSDEAKKLTFFINGIAVVTYTKQAKKIKNRVVFHTASTEFSELFIAVYSKIMYSIIETKDS
ncbi:MAG: hypothetical protein RSC93_00350 [Erysipelotrichaceae bacterium]